MHLETLSAVHIWQLDLDCGALDAYSAILSLDEQARADRYFSESLRCDFMRARCALRLVLAEYSGYAPAGIVFRYGEFGKPEINWPNAGLARHFNLSHSGRHALIAVSAYPVGIDLEYMLRADCDIGALIDIVCHPREKETFKLCPPAQRAALFYRIWSRKEAYCKALGIGLQANMGNLSVEDEQALPIALVQDDRLMQTSRYYSYLLALHQANLAYSASVCLPIPDAAISLRPWALPQ
ncbi:4'-phosphopantetheinyl transferase family protein [Janthinobacterium sp. ROICE36]|uniref:4'-phosphopantetheinyl transferase family protein n=1 Tax=Janthinobacterium sp. ROICE36 TaxID=2048670 RepID=UPI0015E0B97B|nr:4'-phosphopantetheinyl transferase superfamily protein [Janthinobacterium sp. ROICE36]